MGGGKSLAPPFQREQDSALLADEKVPLPAGERVQLLAAECSASLAVDSRGREMLANGTDQSVQLFCSEHNDPEHSTLLISNTVNLNFISYPALSFLFESNKYNNRISFKYKLMLASQHCNPI